MRLFYTWKDIERKVKEYAKAQTLPLYINSIDTYHDVVVVLCNERGMESEIDDLLADMFGSHYSRERHRIFFDEIEGSLRVEIEFEEKEKKTNIILPLFHDVMYKTNAYESDMIEGQYFEDCPVIAFHSYKGGVGRTLSLLAFAKAWSANAPEDKLLIIDSDIEAPGITWMLNGNEEYEDCVSYLDLMELIQTSEIEKENIFKKIVEMIPRTTIDIDTGRMISQHYVIPTYRYEEQLLDIYSSPETIVKGYKKRFILAEILSKLGKFLGVSAVLVDLRAGISEFSAPLLFDPRVKKYFVSSTSFQSVCGTQMILKQVCKGLPISKNTLMPQIFLTMTTKGLDTTDIKSRLVDNYSVQDNSFLDNAVIELPFASELIHLGSITQIMDNLEGRDFYVRMNEIVNNNYILPKTKQVEITDRDKVVHLIHKLASEQINAEGNKGFNVLMTQPINNLIRRFSFSVPQVAIFGAKGSGKTFLFREMLRQKTWEAFCAIDKENLLKEERTWSIPLLIPRNGGEFGPIIERTVGKFMSECELSGANKSYWYDNYEEAILYKKNQHDVLEWKDFWRKCILNAFNSGSQLNDIDNYLQKSNHKVLFLVDGLEEVFENTLDSKNEQDAIRAIVQELLNELKIKYKNIGIIVFMRKDLVSNSIKTNREQLENQNRNFSLSWSHDEALKLALWLVNQAVPGFYNEAVKLEQASKDIIEKYLIKLWGLKLGKDNSNEAYSSRWILAALSDFNAQLQARDIIRFLQNATKNVGKKIYPDRYIMPKEIKMAVQDCSVAKIAEVKDEIAALKPVFEKLDKAPSSKKMLPFRADTFHLTQTEERLLKQEGFLRIEEDKYYLPEIIRHALKFRYSGGARPKVVSFTLK